VANDESMERYLLGDLSKLLLHPQRRAEMAEHVRKLARPDAAQEIATMVVELARLG